MKERIKNANFIEYKQTSVNALGTNIPGTMARANA